MTDALDIRTEKNPEVILQKAVNCFRKRKKVDEKFRIIDSEIRDNLPHITAESDSYFLRVDLENIYEVCKRAEAQGIYPKIIDTFKVETAYATLECVVRRKVYGTILANMNIDQYPRETGKAICEHLENAVDKMHDAGIAHGDLKEDHVLLVMRETTVERLHLFDFGEGCLKEWNKQVFEDKAKSDNMSLKQMKESIKKRIGKK
jgi:serine/threonine protein kinase